MPVKITTRQKELLEIIYNYIGDSGYPPTIKEMRESLGVVSNQSILDLLHHLERKKCIKRKGGIARSIAILPLAYQTLDQPPLAPFLGATSAGVLINAVEISGEWKAISQEISQLQDNIFLLRISGDSMINAGINDGDIVLVKEQKEFISGDIVLAQINGESSIKRFISDDKPPFIYLKPENPKHKVIPFTEKTRLKGKIISIIKNTQWRPVK